MSRWKWYQRPGEPVDHVAGEPSPTKQPSETEPPQQNQSLSPHQVLKRRNQRWIMNEESAQGRAEQAQAAEREAARQRILAQAEAERVPVEETTRAVPDRRWHRDQG